MRQSLLVERVEIENSTRDWDKPFCRDRDLEMVRDKVEIRLTFPVILKHVSINFTVQLVQALSQTIFNIDKMDI